MSVQDHFEVSNEFAILRLTGSATLQESVSLVSGAILRAREEGYPKLLVNAAELTGFKSPSVTERYWFVREWAEAARGMVRVAFVVREEMIDWQKFGITVGRNAGLMGEVFATEAEAVAWLREN